MSQVLRQSFYATLTDDGSGLKGTATIRIAPAGKEWVLTSLNVSGNSNVYEASCTIYENHIGAQYQVDYTNAGSSGDTSDTVHYMHDGDALYAVWNGGDIGAQVTLVIVGTEYQVGEGNF